MSQGSIVLLDARDLVLIEGWLNRAPASAYPNLRRLWTNGSLRHLSKFRLDRFAASVWDEQWGKRVGGTGAEHRNSLGPDAVAIRGRAIFLSGHIVGTLRNRKHWQGVLEDANFERRALSSTRSPYRSGDPRTYTAPFPPPEPHEDMTDERRATLFAQMRARRAGMEQEESWHTSATVTSSPPSAQNWPEAGA